MKYWNIIIAWGVLVIQTSYSKIPLGDCTTSITHHREKLYSCFFGVYLHFQITGHHHILYLHSGALKSALKALHMAPAGCFLESWWQAGHNFSATSLSVKWDCFLHHTSVIHWHSLNWMRVDIGLTLVMHFLDKELLLLLCHLTLIFFIHLFSC